MELNWWFNGSWREAQQRREGHSALRIRDGKLEQFDPHPDRCEIAEEVTRLYTDPLMAAREFAKLTSLREFSPDCVRRHDHTSYDVMLCEDCLLWTVKSVLAEGVKRREALRAEEGARAMGLTPPAVDSEQRTKPEGG